MGEVDSPRARALARRLGIDPEAWADPISVIWRDSPPELTVLPDGRWRLSWRGAQVEEPWPPDDPVGIQEIASRLEVPRRTVDAWRRRGQLPAPRWTVGGRPAWRWGEVHEWALRTGRPHWRRR